MSDFIKRLTGLFGVSKPSPMAKGAIGLTPSSNPEVTKILNEMPKSNRQTGMEDKFKNEWNHTDGTENEQQDESIEEIKKKEEEQRNNMNGEEEGNTEEEEKEDNIFNKLQEFVVPQMTYVSNIVKRHMKKTAGDNPDPSADPQEGMDTRLLDPENPEYKRKKGFGKPFGDAYDGGELKCNVPASVTVGTEHYAYNEGELAKIEKDFARVPWKRVMTPNIEKRYPKNYYKYEGKVGKQPYYVIVRTQDTTTEDAGAYEKQIKVSLMKTLVTKPGETNPLIGSGNLGLNVPYWFDNAEEAVAMLNRINVPTEGVALEKLSQAEMTQKLLNACETQEDDTKKAKLISNAISGAVNDNASKSLVVKFVNNQFKNDDNSRWLKSLFKIISSPDANGMFSPDSITLLLLKYFKKLDFSIKNILQMDNLSAETKREFADKQITTGTNEDKKSAVTQMDDERLWNGLYTGEEWNAIIKRVLPERYEQSRLQTSLADKMRTLPHIKETEDVVSSIRKITENYRNRTPEWNNFQNVLKTNGTVSKDELKDFLESIGVYTKHWSDFLPVGKSQYGKAEINGLFARMFDQMGGEVEKLITFYEDEAGGKGMRAFLKAREEYERLISSTRRDKEARLRESKNIKKALDKMNEIKQKNDFKDHEIAYFDLMEEAMDSESVSADKVRALFASLKGKYSELYPTSIMASLNKEKYTPQEVESLVADFIKILEKVDERNAKIKEEERKKKETRVEKFESPKPPKPFKEMTKEEQDEFKAMSKKMREEWEAKQKENKPVVEEAPAQPQAPKKKTPKPFAYKTDTKVFSPHQFNLYLKYHPSFTPAPIEVLEQNQDHGHFSGIDAEGAICWVTIYYGVLPNGDKIWSLHEIQSDVVTEADSPEYKTDIQNYYADWAVFAMKEALRLAKEQGVKTVYVRTAQAGAQWQSNIPNLLNRIESGEISKEEAMTDVFYRVYYEPVESYGRKKDNGRLLIEDQGRLRRKFEVDTGASTAKEKQDLWQGLSQVLRATEFHVIDMDSVPMEALASGTRGVLRFALTSYRLVTAESTKVAEVQNVSHWVNSLATWIDTYIPRVIEEEVLHLSESQLGGSGKTPEQLRAMVPDDFIARKEQELFETFWWGRSDDLINRGMEEKLCPIDMQYDADAIPAIVKGLRDLEYRIKLPRSFVSYWSGEKTFDSELV